MHAAPPVRMSLAAARAWHFAVALCAGAAGANLAAWVALQAQSPAAVAIAISLAVAAAAWLSTLWRLRRDAAPGVLAWDGAAWRWSPGTAASQAVEPRVMIDLGPWLLLRIAPIEPARPAVWRVAARRHAGASWPQWRAALYARRPDDAPLAAGDPT
jgi:hypothetical protein